MKRWMLIGGLAALTTIPLARALESTVSALGTAAEATWLVALVDVLSAALALCASVLVLRITDGDVRATRMIPLLDWRALVRRRSVSRPAPGATVPQP